MIIRAFYKPKLFLTSILLVLLILASLILKGSGASSIYTSAQLRKVPIYSVDRNDNKISISFDCAYGADYTLTILDCLDEYNIKCTFFCVEFWIKKFPEMAKEIVKRGHEIGTHSKTHPKMSTLNSESIKSELISSIKAIEDVTGQRVELFRPPFGDYNNTLLIEADKLNLYTIQWDVDSLDWKDISSSEIATRVTSKTQSGSIILCHNNAKHTPDALPVIFKNLTEKGYEFVKISELIYKENYKINPQGKQQAVK